MADLNTYCKDETYCVGGGGNDCESVGGYSISTVAFVAMVLVLCDTFKLN